VDERVAAHVQAETSDAADLEIDHRSHHGRDHEQHHRGRRVLARHRGDPDDVVPARDLHRLPRLERLRALEPLAPQLAHRVAGRQDPRRRVELARGDGVEVVVVVM
jgi:hypothetical protein